MRVSVDEAQCMGYGVCVTYAERVFALEGDVATVLLDPVPDELRDVTRTAASDCPSGAIVLADDE